MKVREAKQTLGDIIFSEESEEVPAIFMSGGPGIGKSEIVRQIAEENDSNFIDLRLAQVDPVDLRGLLLKEDGEVKWHAPATLPRNGTRGILFLDELNLAPTSVQHAAYQLVFRGQIGEYELPEGWKVVAAGNKEKHAHVRTMDPPLRNRFFHIDVEPGLKGWKEWALDDSLEKTWASDNVIHEHVIGFINFKSDMLYRFSDNEKQSSGNFPTPRSWELVSHLLDTFGKDGINQELVEGAVGKGAAAEFIGYLEAAEEMPDIDRILEGEDIVPEKSDIVYAVCSSLISKAKEEMESKGGGASGYEGRIVEYGGELPSNEYWVMLVRDAMRAGLPVRESDEFSEFTKENKELIL